jgi:hypothetical protein
LFFSNSLHTLNLFIRFFLLSNSLQANI